MAEGWNLWLTNSQKYTPDPINMTDMEIGANGEAGTLEGRSGPRTHSPDCTAQARR